MMARAACAEQQDCVDGTAGARPRRIWHSVNFDLFTTVPSGLVALLGVAVALPLVLLLSLRGSDGSMAGHGLTLAHYRALWAPLYARVMTRSLVIAGSASILTLLAAYPVAAFLAFHAGRQRTLLLSLVTLPFWTSYLLRVFAWKAILGYHGAINSGLMQLGLIRSPVQSLLYRPPAVLITLSHAYAAFAVLPIYVALRAIDPRLIEAGRDLGAGPLRLFLRIVLPLSLPGVIAAFAIVFVPAFGDYTAPELVGGLSSTMIGNLIKGQFDSVGDWPFGSTLAVLVMLTILPPILLLGLFMRRRSRIGGLA